MRERAAGSSSSATARAAWCRAGRFASGPTRGDGRRCDRLAPSNHGTVNAEATPARPDATPACWQQRDDSKFIAALNSSRRPSPGSPTRSSTRTPTRSSRPTATRDRQLLAAHRPRRPITQRRDPGPLPERHRRAPRIGSSTPSAYALAIDALTHAAPPTLRGSTRRCAHSASTPESTRRPVRPTLRRPTRRCSTSSAPALRTRAPSRRWPVTPPGTARAPAATPARPARPAPEAAVHRLIVWVSPRRAVAGRRTVVPRARARDRPRPRQARARRDVRLAGHHARTAGDGR